MKAIDNEQSLETFEDIMSEDPIPVFTVSPDLHQLSAALGLRGTGIDSLLRWGMVISTIHQALAVGWLPHSCTEPNMQPHPASQW